MQRGGVLPAESKLASFRLRKSGGSGALSDRIASTAITSCALLAIVSLILIFIFIGKEALPIFTSAEVRQLLQNSPSAS